LRNYECLFIVNPNFDGDGISKVIEKVTGYVKKAEAEVAKIQSWGKRRLAYPIEKQQYGNYVLMYFTGEAPKVVDLQHNMELDGEVLAYMTIRLDEMPDFESLSIPEDNSEDDRRFRSSRGRDSYSRSRSDRSGDSAPGRSGRSPAPKTAELAKTEAPEAEADVSEGDTAVKTDMDTVAAVELAVKDEESNETEPATAVAEAVDDKVETPAGLAATEDQAEVASAKEKEPDEQQKDAE